MNYLVDAYNLMHAAPPLRRILEEQGREAAGRALVALLAEWVREHPRQHRVLAVFDGARPRGTPLTPPAPRLELRWMLNRADADLAELLQRAGRHTLVSRDGELVAAARRAGQEQLAPKAFYRLLRDDLDTFREWRQRAPVTDQAELAHWMAEFGGSAAAPPPRSSPPPPPDEPGLSRDEVDAWLDYFGEPREG